MSQAIFNISLIFLLASCASFPKNLPVVDNMILASQYEQALKILADQKAYGKNNELLYLLDKGYIQHLTKNYEDSINTFDKAKQKFDELYTKSISKEVMTWVINDYSAPYHGEDFEHVLINIFQALNYIMIGNHEDALVEARDVDSKLHAINDQYKADQKNVYREDAFARFLMGVLYESGPLKEDINDAFISYVKAEGIYEHDYMENYGVSTPEVLKENLLTTARFMGFSEFSKYKSKYKGVKFISLKEKRKKAEVYIIQYGGLLPIKVEDSIPIPMPDGHIVKIAFPRYKARAYGIVASRLLAKNSQGQVYKADSQLGENIGAIAVENLNRRKLRFIAKSTARATARYLIEKKQEKNIKKKLGDMSAGWFRFFSNMFNLIVEQADLRCWQSLPDQMRISRLILEPDVYHLTVENFSSSGSHLGEFKLGETELRAGQKIFFLIHTPR